MNSWGWKLMSWSILPMASIAFFLATWLALEGVRDGNWFRILFDGSLALLNAYNLKNWFDSRARRKEFQLASRRMISVFAAEHKGFKSGAFIANDFKGNKGIGCLECGMVSWNPNDVKNRYCASCHKYHDKDPRNVISK